MPLTIDRLDSSRVVCENDDGETIVIDANAIPCDAAEGDILMPDANGYVIDKAATLKRREAMHARLTSLFAKNENS